MKLVKNFVGWFWKPKWHLGLLVPVVGLSVFALQPTLFAKQEIPKTVQPELREISETLEVSGAVDAEEKASLPFPSAARLSWIGVKEGDAVKKWQTLASLDTRALQKQLQQDLNAFNKEFREHDQVLDDNDYYGNADINRELKRILENANYDLQNTVLTVEIRDLAIRLASIVSPINGVVTKIDKPYAGANVSVTDSIEIVNPATIYFAAVVDEVDIAGLAEGMPVSINLDSFPKETITSTIRKIDFTPSASRNGGTGYKIHLPISEEQSKTLRLGMNGTATVELKKSSQAMTIPTDAVILRDGKSYVEVWDGTTKQSRQVTVGIESDDLSEILDGLSPSDAVVLPTKEG